MSLLRVLAAFIASLHLPCAALADLAFQLTPSEQPSAPGGTVVFKGTLTNTSTTDKLFLNDIQATLAGGSAIHAELKTNAFFANVPGILLPGETYSGPVFQMKLDASTPTGNYAGMVAIQGGTGIFASTPLATSSLTLLATPVEQWRFNSFGADATSLAASDTGDWDHDGVANLLEYALGMNATIADRTALPKAFAASGHLAISYLPAADVTYVVESSSDLIQWTTTNIEAISLANPDPPGSVTFRYKALLSSTGRIFLRIRVTR